MIRFAKFLWTGCFHVWEDVGEVRTVTDDCGQRYYMQPMRCKKCGERTRAKC